MLKGCLFDKPNPNHFSEHQNVQIYIIFVSVDYFAVLVTNTELTIA